MRDNMAAEEIAMGNVQTCHERTPRESGRAAREIEEVESG